MSEHQVTNWHACKKCLRACGVRLLAGDEKLPEPLDIGVPQETRFVSQCCGALVNIKSARN